MGRLDVCHKTNAPLRACPARQLQIQLNFKKRNSTFGDVTNSIVEVDFEGDQHQTSTHLVILPRNPELNGSFRLNHGGEDAQVLGMPLEERAQ